MVDRRLLSIPRCVHPVLSELEKTFRINIGIRNGLRHRFVWPKLYYLGRAINTGYEVLLTANSYIYLRFN